MDFNKRISKFLVRLTLASSIVSSVGCTQVFAMEDINEIPSYYYELALPYSQAKDAYDQAKNKVQDIAWEEVFEDLNDSEANILQVWINSNLNYYEYAVKSIDLAPSYTDKINGIESFFQKFNNEYSDIKRQSEGDLYYMLSLGKNLIKKSIFGVDNDKCTENHLKERIKVYFAYLFYFDFAKEGARIPDIINTILDEFDKDQIIRTKIVSCIPNLN